MANHKFVPKIRAWLKSLGIETSAGLTLTHSEFMQYRSLMTGKYGMPASQVQNSVHYPDLIPRAAFAAIMKAAGEAPEEETTDAGSGTSPSQDQGLDEGRNPENGLTPPQEEVLQQVMTEEDAQSNVPNETTVAAMEEAREMAAALESGQSASGEATLQDTPAEDLTGSLDGAGSEDAPQESQPE